MDEQRMRSPCPGGADSFPTGSLGFLSKFRLALVFLQAHAACFSPVAWRRKPFVPFVSRFPASRFARGLSFAATEVRSTTLAGTLPWGAPESGGVLPPCFQFSGESNQARPER